jgi:predicted metal-dependent phosphoesterase TrpH
MVAAVCYNDPMERLKVDLHTHTEASFDCRTTPRDFIAAAVAAGLGAVAVTDHGTIDGARRVRDLGPPFAVIAGQEILTREGEIVGLFLTESVPRRLPAEDAIARVRDQGGLVMLPHPFCPLAIDRVKGKARARIAPLVDVVEVTNARNHLPSYDARAEAWAAGQPVARAANSDAHTAEELGRAYQLVRPFEGPRDFLDALRGAELRLERRTSVVRSLALQVVGLVRTRRFR